MNNLYYCHVTGGYYNFDFHRILSMYSIKIYRDMGCKVDVFSFLISRRE